MAAQVVFVLMLAMVGVSDGAWCVCRSDKSDTELQKTLDFACGANADCKPIHQGGACYDPNTVKSHCSYAANSYYQKQGQSQIACNFSGTALITSVDPSYSGCTYPATASSAGTSSTPATGTTTSTIPTTFSPPSSALGPAAFLNEDGALVTEAGMGLLMLGIAISWMALFN